MRIISIVISLFILILGVRMLPYERSMSFSNGVMFCESASDTGEAEDNEWEKSPKDRHCDDIGRDADPFLARISNRLAHGGARIGDRGADDIHTPPPDARG